MKHRRIDVRYVSSYKVYPRYVVISKREISIFKVYVLLHNYLHMIYLFFNLLILGIIREL